MKPQNPYVGPRAFQDGEILYGRDREVSKLLNLLIAERIVLLYSPSGAGKTSLIQAALMPALREEGFRVFPIIRVGMEPPPDIEFFATTNRYILSTLLSLEEGLPSEQQTPLEELTGMDLSTYLDWRLAEAGEMDGDVLIFDQFEEILTVDPTDQKAKAAYFAQVGQALRPRNRWVLFAMREEYPAGLDPYLRPIPTRLSTTFRLELLGAKAARQSMQEPARQAGVPFTDTAAMKLSDDLRRVQVQQPDGTTAERPGLYIEPVQLQVVCYRLWENLPDGATEIRETDIREAGDVDSALAGYYADRVKTTAESTGVRERAIREWFNSQLITEQGIRGQVLRGPEQSQGLENQAITPLVDAHLVRVENRRGATWYELAHDRLIAPVRKNNAEWFQANLSTLQRQSALWDEQHRPEGLLLHDESLDEAEQWAAAHQTDMTQNEQEFLAACRKARAIIERERRLTEELRVLTVELREKLAESERQNRISLAQLLSFQALDQQLYYKDTLSALLARQAYLLNEQAQAMTGWVQIDKALRSAVVALCFKSVILTHAQQVGGVAFSPDGTALVSGDWEGAIRFWDVTTGTELTVLRGHTGPVTSVAFSPDGQTLASASGDWTIRLWDVADRKERTVLQGHQELIHSVVFSPDGLTLASGSQDQTIRLWDVASRKEQAVLQGHTKGVRSVTFSPDGATLASGSYDQTVRLWDVASKQERKMLWHSVTLVRAIAFSPDGQTLASGCHDQTIRLWDVASGKQQVVLRGHKSLVDALAFSPDGQTLASVSWDNTVRLWNVDSGQELKILRGHTRLVFSVAFSPDGKTLASGSWDTTVRLWDITIEQESNVLRGHDRPVTTVAFSPDGRTLASGSWDKSIRLWDAASGVEQAILEDQLVWSVAFSPNGRVLASGSEDHIIRLWDVIKKQEQTILRGHEDAVYSVVFSPDGKTLASGSLDTTIRLWDMTTGKERALLRGHKMKVTSVAFSPDGQTLASASMDLTIRLWDVTSGKERSMLQGHTASTAYGRFALAFSPDGKTLAWGGSQDKSIWLWDVANQQEQVVLRGHDLMVHSLAFSPDGNTLASGSEDHTVRLWDTITGTERAILRGHERGVVAVTFSPDGQTLASSSGDHTIRLWIWRTEMLAEMVCDKVWRNLTMEEWRQFVSPDIPYERTCPNLPPGEGAPSDAPAGAE